LAPFRSFRVRSIAAAMALDQTLLQFLGLRRECASALVARLLAHEAQALGDAQHFEGRGVLDVAEGREGAVEDGGILLRADREFVLVVPDAERAFRRIELQREGALFEGLTVALAEEGHHELVVGTEPRPVDVERVGRGREATPFQHGEPPRIVGAADAHVVGHDVEQKLQAGAVQRLREANETLLAAELRVDRRVVDDVVAMGRARPRLLNG
jgi:hypothetical protein